MGGFVQPEREQMEQYAEAFYGLARLFEEMPCQKERLDDGELRTLFEDVRERTCAGCQRDKACWGEDSFKNCRALYGLLRELEMNGAFSDDQESYLEEACERPRRLALALRMGYEEARSNLLWSNRMLEQRRAAGEQIYQTAELLKHTAEGFADAPEREFRIARRLRRELRFLSVELDSVRVFLHEEGKQDIYLTLHGRKRAVVSAKTIAEALSDCCGEKMRPAFNCSAAVSSAPLLFHFVPDTKYQLFCGIARITKSGEMVSGDNYALLQKDTGKVLMSLADGMGSGTEANRESEKVIELLEQFLGAGFPQETAVRMINSCMLLQNSSRIYSTIDLCMVDLYNATCDMIKSGAAASFIRKTREIEVLRSNAFPTGVMQQSDYESMHRRLEAGTSIVMMTDGVLDALPEDNREQAMAELIVKTMSRNAQEYARRLMERVYLMQKLQARDDMTILIGNLWEK
ncbi:MAG: SpoIIE family protein phosphatase [Lachnospiraceae bacterium]|nr:SpoIIE family protein phosphatase [Lachnospiraceae bacterium]